MADLKEMYERVADELRGAAEQAADKVYRAWQAGRLTDAEFKGLLLKALSEGVDTGRRAADIIGTRVTGGTPAGLGISALDMAALAKAAATMADLLDEPDLTLRTRRVVVGETLHALQQGVVDNYRHNGVEGYTREISADACELCVWLRKEHLRPGGYIYPTDQPMYEHPGCRCTPSPVIEGENE